MAGLSVFNWKLAMSLKPSIETKFEQGLFASRWLMAPMYLGLVISLAMMAVLFVKELAYYLPKTLTMTADQGILAVLTLIDLSLAEQSDAVDTLKELKDITDQLLVRTPSYRCTRCGFGARTHHWQCPSCKEWGAVKPLLNYAVV